MVDSVDSLLLSSEGDVSSESVLGTVVPLRTEGSSSSSCCCCCLASNSKGSLSSSRCVAVLQVVLAYPPPPPEREDNMFDQDGIMRDRVCVCERETFPLPRAKTVKAIAFVVVVVVVVAIYYSCSGGRHSTTLRIIIVVLVISRERQRLGLPIREKDLVF